MTAVAFTETSDQNLKTSIQTCPDCLALVGAIQPHRYRFDETRISVDDGVAHDHWGFTAQEVGDAMAAAGYDFGGYHAPHTGSDGTNEIEMPAALTHSELLAVLWKAVQELSAEVAALKTA